MQVAVSCLSPQGLSSACAGGGLPSSDKEASPSGLEPPLLTSLNLNHSLKGPSPDPLTLGVRPQPRNSGDTSSHAALSSVFCYLCPFSVPVVRSGLVCAVHMSWSPLAMSAGLPAGPPAAAQQTLLGRWLLDRGLGAVDRAAAPGPESEAETSGLRSLGEAWEGRGMHRPGHGAVCSLSRNHTRPSPWAPTSSSPCGRDRDRSESWRRVAGRARGTQAPAIG